MNRRNFNLQCLNTLIIMPTASDLWDLYSVDDKDFTVSSDQGNAVCTLTLKI